jgi:hypothetical protein
MGGAGLAGCGQRLDFRGGYWDWLYDELESIALQQECGATALCLGNRYPR